MITGIPTYPVQFSVDYPNRELDRVTTFFRLIVAIPILVVVDAVAGTTWTFPTPTCGKPSIAGCRW